MAAIRRPFKDPNHLALQELGWESIQDYSKGHYQRVYILSISCKASSISILLGQLNWSIQAAINQPVCLGPIGPIHIPLWEFSHTAQISRFPDLYGPSSDNTASDSPSRISLSTFHIYWPPFST
ncbi:hypothetical protein O181_082493 [Austropuccinia psidii MF-1]|uniref:Uncharacterized protein n=1 Tax=Austropuccinia psidii MF-1 TaxID=1389203 RepID=A0A9Q3FMK0_9BASI|nr:hypothetical protein [Austropuccinia psidii MF-1]